MEPRTSNASTSLHTTLGPAASMPASHTMYFKEEVVPQRPIVAK